MFQLPSDRRIWILLFALLCLPAPFVWMKIGPLGYQNYGPDVPDIWIYGACITGKDLSWKPIWVAQQFQLAVILIFCVLTLFQFFKVCIGLRYVLLIIQLILLLLFPIWLLFYMQGVMNNSDGADLSIHFQWGCVVYLILLVLVPTEMWHRRRMKIKEV
jgi:hypothetical protein